MDRPDARGRVLPRTRPDSAGVPVRDMLSLLAGVHDRLVEGLTGLRDGPTAEWGPDHALSAEPAAALLRTRGVGFEWTLVAFPGWSLWDLHVGVVPRGGNALALGLHWHESLCERVPAAVQRPAAAAIGTSFHPLSHEHHADLLVLAWRALAPERAVQILSDAALELALSLRGPLAHAHELSQPHPTVPRSSTHDW